MALISEEVNFLADFNGVNETFKSTFTFFDVEFDEKGSGEEFVPGESLAWVSVPVLAPFAVALRASLSGLFPLGLPVFDLKFFLAIAATSAGSKVWLGIWLDFLVGLLGRLIGSMGGV